MLQEGESLFAFLDGIYLVCQPHRAMLLFDAVASALWHHARVQANLGKTRVWNSSGTEPHRCRELGSDGNPCWVGDQSLPASAQGLQVLGAPVGSEEYVQEALRKSRERHDKLLERLPLLPSLQSA